MSNTGQEGDRILWSRVAGIVAVVVLVIVGVVFVVGKVTSSSDGEDSIYGRSACVTEDLPKIDKDLGGANVQQRVKDMIAVAKAERANEVELQTMVVIAFAETHFGGMYVPDADEYDIFSQKVEDGVQGDPTTSARKMLGRIRSVAGNEKDPAKVAALAARSNDNKKYVENADKADRIIAAVGGC